MQKIIDHLMGRYAPEVLIVYGSYADGTNGPESDFDAIVITGQAQTQHDTTSVDGVQMDVFVYAPGEEPSPEDLPQLYHCRLVHDTDGRGKQLIEQAVACVHSTRKSEEEIRNNVAWCEKMLNRATRGDAEGFFRWHWVLCDSLEFYCDLRGQYYFGPKKTLLWMRANDPKGCDLYYAALTAMEYPKLEAWVNYLKSLLNG